MVTDEQILIRRAQKGDTAAFESLVSLHATYIYNLALRTVGNAREAEDITQDALVRVWKALPRYRAEAQFRTWLYRIVTNLCYNKLPKIKRNLHTLDADEQFDLQDEGQQVEGVVVSAETRAYLHAAVQQLPENYRLLITLRHLQGMSYAEIAEATDMPLGTVKTGIFRARKELRLALQTWREQNKT